MSMIKISPSILSADFANLERAIKELEDAGADMIHIDVMDGHFVPNLTIGPPVIKSLRKHTNIPFDVHLMIDRPELFIKQYVDAGADIITFHPEATKIPVIELARQIKKYKIKAGIAIKPQTNIDIIEPYLKEFDLILIMTVEPGFAGQKFLQKECVKIQQISNIVLQNQLTNIIISVDGGINDLTAKQAISSGATCLVSGNYIFSGDYREKIKNLQIFT